jgi:tetratricopeptide (TPR) repeat protein
MRNTILSILLFLTSPLWGQNGDDLYRMGDYQAAAEAYEATLAGGLSSPELHYNLGGAYYHEGQFGKAILNYERALRLDPSFTDAKENLALANSHTVDRIAVLPQPLFVRWWNSLCTALLPSGWRIVWLVIFTILVAAIVVLRIGNTVAIRKTALAASAASVLLLIAATALLIGSTHRFNAHSEAIVTQQAVTLKASPDAKSADKMTVHEGTKATITDELPGWYKITLSDGTVAWCTQEAIERI